jgi:hypothetical protein
LRFNLKISLFTESQNEQSEEKKPATNLTETIYNKQLTRQQKGEKTKLEKR